MKCISRREFFKRSLIVSSSACCAAAWGPASARTALAQLSGGSSRTLLMLNQFGGNDHLNSFAVPYTVPAYYDLRPTIAIPEANVLPMANGIGLNPVLINLHRLYQDGDVAVIQAAGDPIGNRSHFTSQEYFSRGIIDYSGNSDQRGWMGRLGDLYLTDTPFNTFGLGVGQQVDFTSNRARNRPIVAYSLDSYGFDDDYYVSFLENETRRSVVQGLLARQKLLTARKTSARSAQSALYDSIATLQNVIGEYSSTIAYPDSGVGRYFRDSARLIQSNRIATQLLYGGLGGWDTHSDQVGEHEARLSEIDTALLAFSNDLKAMGKWDEVAICIFTEFGRVNFENASHGTDHAKGGAMVLIGGAVRGGVFGPTPTSFQLSNDDYIDSEIDFRNVFAQAVQWLGYNPTPVFPESYSRVNLTLF